MKQALLFLFASMLLLFSGCEKRPHACLEASAHEVREGDSVTFTSCSENAKRYVWDFGDGVKRNGEATMTRQMNDEGYQMVSLWVYGDIGYEVAQQDVTVYKVTAEICRYDSLVDPGEQVSFENCSADGDSYLWNFGDGTTSTVDNRYPVRHTYNTPGIYLVTLTMSAAEGRITHTDTARIGVSGVPLQNYLPGTYLVSDTCKGEYLITLTLSGDTATIHNLGNFAQPVDIHGTVDSAGGYINFPWQTGAINPTVGVTAYVLFNMFNFKVQYEYSYGGPHSTCWVTVVSRQ